MDTIVVYDGLGVNLSSHACEVMEEELLCRSRGGCFVGPARVSVCWPVFTTAVCFR